MWPAPVISADLQRMRIGYVRLLIEVEVAAIRASQVS